MIEDLPLISLPLWILLFSAIFCILFWNSVKVQQVIAVVGTTLYLVSSILLIVEVYHSGVLAIQLGAWPAPFGITLVADLLSAIMVSISAITAFALVFYSIQDLTPVRKSNGYYPLFLFLLFGVTGSFLAGDVFNLYVWFEVMLVASFVLISLGSTKSQLEGSVKYVILNFISSGFFLTGVGILYKATGSLNMADLAGIIKTHDDPGIITLSAVFFFISFGIKAAVFPMFSWLPASYHTPPIAISGLMAGLLTKVGVYAMIRFFTLMFVHDTGVTHTVLLFVAGFTMLTGVLGAMAQNEFRKILAFHIISQIGYMIMGLALFTPLAVAGGIFFIINNIMVKTNLFLISGVVKAAKGQYLLKKLGGIYGKFPLITVLFVISAFSLAGVPPLSGFWGKFMLAKAGLEIQEYTIVAVSLLVGLFTLFSMTKIWDGVFWGKDPDEEYVPEYVKTGAENTMMHLFKAKYLMILPIVFLALVILFFSFHAEFIVGLSTQAAEQLFNPESYIKAVLNP
jgi:multicomponent Na+:H+ antiporter subunit D